MDKYLLVQEADRLVTVLSKEVSKANTIATYDYKRSLRLDKVYSMALLRWERRSLAYLESKN